MQSISPDYKARKQGQPPAGWSGGHMKGCKGCPAYAKCTVTYRGSACAALRGTYGIDSDPEIVTNADLVRTMSDEELAGYLAEISGGTVLKMAAQLGIPLDQEKNERYIDRLKEEYLKRLQQPAEEDE